MVIESVGLDRGEVTVNDLPGPPNGPGNTSAVFLGVVVTLGDSARRAICRSPLAPGSTGFRFSSSTSGQPQHLHGGPAPHAVFPAEMT